MLLQIGAWLKINGDAIYGSRPFTVFGEGPTIGPKDSTAKNSDIQTYTAEDIRYTTSHDGRQLYAAAMAWPSTGSLTLHTLFAGNPYLPGSVCAVSLLGTTLKIPTTQAADGLHLTLPTTPPAGLNPLAPAVFHLQTKCS